MTIITRLRVTLLLIAVALPFAAACNDGEFWFQDKNCCLPFGGPSWHPSPPTDKHCPSQDWSWNEKQGCCTPHYPNPEPPQCDNDWEWWEPEFCCKKHQPQPSNHYWKRAPVERDYTQLCPMGLIACPIAGINGPSTDFECLDTTNELESCGGCASIDQGQDCTAIEGAWNVGCELGRCAVYTCAPGFNRSRDGNSCHPI